MQHGRTGAVTGFAAKQQIVLAMLVGVFSSVFLPGQTLADSSQADPDDQRSVAELNISIAVFDPGVPANPALYRDLDVFPRVRQIETLFLPFVLREVLVATNEWGAVRVVPEPDIAAELLISGEIIKSDGDTLELALRAVDASGRVWFDKTYSDVANQSDSAAGISDHPQLYAAVAHDLRTARAQLDIKALRAVVNLSMLRYANQLAPSAFGEYLTEAADGTYSVNRLPAANDPMVERIERIRSVEYVITDAVDGKFRELHAEIDSIYELWHEYRREFAQYQVKEANRLLSAPSDAPRGSYEAMKERYDNYKWDRLAVQEQEKWARGFNNEVGPKVSQMEARVAEIEGWVDQQYSEWSRLLAELFVLETSLEE